MDRNDDRHRIAGTISCNRGGPALLVLRRPPFGIGPGRTSSCTNPLSWPLTVGPVLLAGSLVSASHR